MTDVDLNNRQAQRWQALDTKRLDRVSGSARVDPKQQGLYDAIVGSVKAGLQDLYGNANDRKYLYIVNLIMSRIRAAMAESQESASESQNTEIAELVKNALSEQSESLEKLVSDKFQQIASDAFKDIKVDASAGGAGIGSEQFLQQIKEYVEDGAKKLKEAQSEDVKSSFEEFKQKLETQFGAGARAASQAAAESSAASAKAKFATKAQKLFLSQMTKLAKNQKRIQAGMTSGFKSAQAFVGNKVFRLNAALSGSISAIGDKIGKLGKRLSQMSVGGMAASLGKWIVGLIAGGPLKLITEPLSMLWSGVSGLVKWAAGGIFSAVWKFIKSPVGIATVAYGIGYVWGRWIKPWWNNIAKTELGKMLRGEQKFGETVSNIVKDTFGIDRNDTLMNGMSKNIKKWLGFDEKKGLAEQIWEKVTSTEICRFDNPAMACIADAISQAGELLNISPPSTSGSFTIGSALTTMAGLIAFNVASSILGSPVFMIATGVGAAILAMKAMLDKLMEHFGVLPAQTTTAMHETGAVIHAVTKPIRDASTVAKGTRQAANAAKKVKETAQALDKADEAVKAAQRGVQAAEAAGDARGIAKANDALAKAQRNGDKALKSAIKAEESLENILAKIGIKSDKVGKFGKWLGQYPKIVKAIKFLGPIGVLTSAAASIFELYQAYEAYEKGQTGMAVLKVAKATNAIVSLATGPAGMAIGAATDLVLDRAVEWQSAMYDVEAGTKMFDELNKKSLGLSQRLAQKKLGGLSPDEKLKMQIEQYAKIKKQYDSQVALQKEWEAKLDHSGFFGWGGGLWDKATGQEANNKAGLELALTQQKQILTVYGFDPEKGLPSLEELKAKAAAAAEGLNAKAAAAAASLSAKTIKLDFETHQVAQRVIDEMRLRAQQTPDAHDDQIVEKIQEEFNAGNAQVIAMLTQIIKKMSSTGHSSGGIIINGAGGFDNPAMIDAKGRRVYTVDGF